MLYLFSRCPLSYSDFMSEESEACLPILYHGTKLSLLELLVSGLV